MASVNIIDGYIDEPAALGVPPFVHPQVRAVAGAALDAGGEIRYLTADRIREGEEIPECDLSVLLAGCSVPGRYLRTSPMSVREILHLVPRLPGVRLLGGPATAVEEVASHFEFSIDRDPAATVFDLLTEGRDLDRWRGVLEWNRWMIMGSQVVTEHPDFPHPLIVEIETYRGCLRYRSGGCSFCVEPLKGEPVFREVDCIHDEVRALKDHGVRHFRLGGQTCFVSYKADTYGGEVRPRPSQIENLLSGIADIGVETLHLDNADPSVIARFPERSSEILNSIVKYCSSGNVLALGMESADPAVVEENNLNATPEEVFTAVRLINEMGKERGDSGLPRLLPGINFIIGLDGESERTLELNLEFLRGVKKSGHLLRRINIRQVEPIRRDFTPGVTRSQFLSFKRRVREEIDHPMLKKVVPIGTVLRHVFTEIRRGKKTFGRQVGTYPLLVGLEYPVDLEIDVAVKITDWGERSVTGVEYPLAVNSCPLGALESLPGIGKKRAGRIAVHRPLTGPEELREALDSDFAAEGILPFLEFDSRATNQ